MDNPNILVRNIDKQINIRKDEKKGKKDVKFADISDKNKSKYEGETVILKKKCAKK